MSQSQHCSMRVGALHPEETGSEREADDWSRTGTEVKNTWICAFALPYVFML
jgi:hypothetical protein